MEIRPATPADAEATAAIYNDEVTGSTVTFDLVTRTVEEQADWLSARSGALEAVFSVKTMQSGIIPPTINYKVPDPSINLDVVPNVKRNADISSTMSNSFGFGGQNACLVLTREPV